MDKHTVFDTLIEDLMSDASGTELLEESMSFDTGRVSKVPLRYRIIALGFVRNYSLDELNKKLQEAGCARLYARSLWEASLIYAFSNGLSYREWLKLQNICDEFRTEQDLKDPYFTGSAISMSDMEKYLKDGSDEMSGILSTRHLTRLIEQRIVDTAADRESFREFLLANVEAFSPVREKTRYYFCKYLYYMLISRIDRYLSELKNGIAAEDAFSELVVFKGITRLKRKKHTDFEAREFLLSADLSCGEIFDAFNYFYFEYVSLDWMQVLIEYYGNIDSLPPSARHTLAEYLRKYDPSAYSSSDDNTVLSLLQKKTAENEAALDEIYSLEGSGRGYQRNRSGENTLRKYIKGSLDIDRTTLLCFLLFFADQSSLSPEEELSRSRLNQILTECGFPSLRKEDDFDSFVMTYLESDDPVGYLMEEVTNYALDEENFYLYRVYQSSSSYMEDFEKLIGISSKAGR